MFCKKCGKQLADGIRFCGFCGTPVSAADVKTVPVKKRKKPLPFRKLLPVAAALAAAALVIVLLSSLFGRQTVWMVTKEVQRVGTSKSVIEYSYGKDGRLLEYNNDGYVVRYEYKDDRLVSAEINDDNYVEYNYDKKGNLVSMESDYLEAEVTLDKKGRIVECVMIDNRDSDYEMTFEFSYHANGYIAEMTYEIESLGAVVRWTNWTYSPSGELLKKEVDKHGEKYSTETHEFNSEGKLVESTTENHYFDVSTTEYREYDKKGNWVGYTLSEDGKDIIECEVIGDKTHAEAIVTWSAVDYVEEGDTYIEETYDKHGNLIEQTVYAEEKARYTWEYEKQKASRNYFFKDILMDPRYGLLI